MTAGGGGMGHEGQAMGSHVGLMEGLGNAAELRERILARSQLNAGLGDERGPEQVQTVSATGFQVTRQFGESPENMRLLKEIHELTGRLAR